MQWSKGDILRGKIGTEAVHPIIFLEGQDDTFFIGAMITSSSSSDYSDNILMQQEHFESHDHNGEKYKLYFKNTYLVEAKLLKRLEWRPFTKVGQLTDAGTEFVERKMKEKSPVVWEEYLDKSSS